MRIWMILIATAAWGAEDRALEARDRGDVAALQKAIEEAHSQAESFEGMLRLAQLHEYLCEAAHGAQDNKLLKKAAEEGVAAAEAAVRREPNSSEAHRLVGALLGEMIPHVFAGGMRHGPRSTKELDRALEIDPGNAKAHVARALSYHFTPAMFGGSEQKAIETLQRAVAIDPKCDTAYIWMAQLYVDAKQREKAKAAIREALRINPKRGWARYVARLAGVQEPSERFDLLVREDFFAGMFGDAKRLDRGMEYCERVLAGNPNHAEALVWHGSGLVTRSTLAADSESAARLWEKGLEEMNRGRELAPKNMGVKIGRSALLIGMAQSGWDSGDARARALLESAVKDYEEVLEEQRSYLSKIDTHGKGELLFGLASGWSRLGDAAKARGYLEKVIEYCKGSEYEKEARGFLSNPLASVQHTCIGCHSSH